MPHLDTLTNIILLTFVAVLISLAAFAIYFVKRGYREIWETTRLSNFEDRRALKTIRRGEKILARALNDPKVAYNLSSKKIKTVEEYLNYATYDLLLTDNYIRQSFLMLIQTRNISVDKLYAYYREFQDLAIRDMILKSPKLSIEEKTFLALPVKDSNLDNRLQRAESCR